MAIRIRRGAYQDLDTSKLVSGEMVVTTSGEEYVGVMGGNNNMVRVATRNDLSNIQGGEITVENETLVFSPRF